MTEGEMKEITLSMLARAHELTDNPAAICSALYQGLIYVLATHFPGEAHIVLADMQKVALTHLTDALSGGGTKQ